jgi:hypothetical protein
MTDTPSAPVAPVAASSVPTKTLPTPDQVSTMQSSFDAWAATQHPKAAQPSLPAQMTAPERSAPAEQPAPTEPSASTDIAPKTYYDIPYTSETPAAKILENQAAVNAIVLGLGHTPEIAKGAVSMIAQAQHARGGKPLDALEINSLEALLHTRFGDKYEARMDRVTAVLQKLGPRGAHLQHVMNTVDPHTSAWMFESLSRGTA